MATIRTLSEPRSTAYYYGDLERLKGQDTHKPHQTLEVDPPRNELSEYLESNEVFNEPPKTEVPPFRDRPIRQQSLPEYHTPENCRQITDTSRKFPGIYNTPEGSRRILSDYRSPEGSRKFPGDYRVPESSRNPGETYSTAGTFPMPKEKEPLLAELEVVGRLPLTQLDAGSGVRRSRSWYLCCPNVEEEMSRESSWRYSSLRPVTAPPVPRNEIAVMLATQSSTQDDAAALRSERDSLARTLSAERQRAAAAARAHDARLAELHGVIAELMRRRERDQSSRAIPEEDTSERSDECESTTQPAGELDNDADKSPTDQNDSSSILSPAEMPSASVDPPEISCDIIGAAVESESNQEEATDKNSDRCLSTARCCQYSLETHSGSRSHRSVDERRLKQPASPGSFRQAKLASRVRLRRTEDSLANAQININDDAWCAEAAEKLALDVAAQADLREAMVTANSDGVARAADTAHRLATACAVHESSTVALCSALLAADRALEAYDVLLALAETQQNTQKRSEAELVAQQLLQRLNSEMLGATIGEPLLSPGPWLLHNPQSTPTTPWTDECERDLRSHAARLKSETATLRVHRPPPQLFSYHDDEEDSEQPKPVSNVSMADMEAAVMMQEVLLAREERACALAALATERARVTALARALGDRTDTGSHKEVLLAREERACALAALATERARVTALARALGDRADTGSHKTGSTRSRGRHTKDRDRHWLEPPSETEL